MINLTFNNFKMNKFDLYICIKKYIIKLDLFTGNILQHVTHFSHTMFNQVLMN